ncbi:MAG: hypothetical protein L0211_08790 [Planctomycetaceae bacterium]|nr:hypothetical protein [Planctomycetaceae bacterium]
MVEVADLSTIKLLLSQSKIAYWIEENAISLNVAPEIAVVNFGRHADPMQIQQALDQAP